MIEYVTAAELKKWLLDRYPHSKLNKTAYGYIYDNTAFSGHIVVLTLKSDIDFPRTIAIKDIDPANIEDGFACGSRGSLTVCRPELLVIHRKIGEASYPDTLPMGSGNRR